MKKSTIAIEGFSKQYRNVLIERIERAAHKSGSWIIDLTPNPDKGISLLIETKTDRLGNLYDCLEATQLNMEADAKDAFSIASGTQEVPGGVFVNLNVRFEAEQGNNISRENLRILG
jgi:hypothetical protein